VSEEAIVDAAPCFLPSTNTSALQSLIFGPSGLAYEPPLW